MTTSVTKQERPPFQSLRRLVPKSWRKAIRRAAVIFKLPTWLRIWSAGTPDASTPLVSYGYPNIPGRDQHAFGGIVKFQNLQSVYPNSPHRFNLLYLGSSRYPQDWQQLLWLAHRKGARLVWNQNGVAYPAWFGAGWAAMNAPMQKMLHHADYVIYQSHFCKLSADRYLGEIHAPWEILYNPIDTHRFFPGNRTPDLSRPILLAAGTHRSAYRVDCAIQTLSHLLKTFPGARLIIAGRLLWAEDAHEQALQTAARLGVSDRIEFLGVYTQNQAPDIFHRADILLHAQYNDASPTLLLEAMACALPVVYSASGGSPELVGDHAGVGVPVPQSWDETGVPDPLNMTRAVLDVLGNYNDYAQAARRRAVEQFDAILWVERHRAIFTRLLEKNG